MLSTWAALAEGNTTDDKEAQLANAEAPTEVTAAGIATEIRPLPANADTAIVNKDAGNCIVCNAVQPLKAFAGIAVTPSGTSTDPASGVITQLHFGSAP